MIKLSGDSQGGTKKALREHKKYHGYTVRGTPNCQWIFQVPVKGGRDYIIPQLAVYTTYIPLIYCLLGGI